MPDERLGKLLAAAGVASRRGADSLIEAGRVTVDGRVAALGEKIDPATARVAIDGRAFDLRAGLEAPAVYLAFHKPAGVTSTVADPHAEYTVLEYVPPELRPASGRLYQVGRLDLDSEGLLLLTNDGEWTERVIHPRHEVEREYAVAIAETLSEPQRTILARGVILEEGHAVFAGLRPATRTETVALARLVHPAPSPRLIWYRVTLAQGWKRQVRRMFSSVGAPVIRLVRVRVGPVHLDVAAGAVRRLTAPEVRRLGSSTPAPPPGSPPRKPRARR